MSMLHKVKSLWWLLCLVYLVQSVSYISMTVSPSTTEINAPATYSFVINRQYDPVNFKFISSPSAVPLSSTVVITLPSQFTTISSSSTLPCTNTANSQSLTCSVNVAAKTITITDYYTSSSSLSNTQITFNVFTLINAYKAGASDNFFWQIVAPNSTTIEQGPPIGNTVYSTSIIYTAGSFQSCSISARGAYVSSLSPVVLDLSPTNPIPSTGQLIIILPLYWATDPLQSSTIASTPSCSGIANTSSSLSCNYTSDPTQQIITVSGISTSSTSLPFSFQIANLLIPPTVGSSESITMYSQWPDGTQIDSCATTISNIVVAPFQTVSMQSNDNTTIQSTFTAKLQLSLSRNFYYQDSILLTLPSIFINAQISSSTFSSFTKSSDLNVITLTSFPSSPTVIPSNNIITINLANISNPLSTAPVSITIALYRNNEVYQQSSLNYAATSATVNSFGIAADSSFVQSVGRATFTITTLLQIPAGSSIYVVYPSTMTGTSVSSTSVTLATLNGSVVAGVLYQVSNNQITFSNLFSTNFAGNIVLIINSFTNPPTVQSSTYLIQVNDQSGYLVMSGSQTIVATTKALVSNAVSASSYQVLQSGVTYYVSITTNFAFTEVSIIVPSDITIGSSFQGTCAPSSFYSCSLSGTNLTFFGTLPAGSYTLQWGYVTNPNSFLPTSSFQIYTYNNGYGVQNSQGVLKIAMNSTAPFSNLILYPSSYVNSAPISVTLVISLPAGTPAGQLSIKVPSELVITSASCSGCTISSPYIYLSLAASVSNLTVVISNLTNVGSFQSVSAFEISLFSSAGYSSLSSSISGWTNNQKSTFTTSVQGNKNYMGESNNFKFQLSGLSTAQSYVIIKIDSSFGALTSAPSGFTLVDSYTLKVACTGSACTFNFTIVNPTTNSSYVFALTSYVLDNSTGLSYEVGSSTSNSWTFDCYTTNCRSCLSNGSCDSCYNSSISNYYILNTFTNSCERACQVGYFLINTTCTICNSNCSECTNTSKTCTSCASGFYLDTFYAICVPSCLSGYFANALSQSCAICTAPCATCQTTSVFCLSCTQSHYFFNNSCLTTCPTNYYIANTVTLNCDACNANCLTCTNTTTYCLTCNNSLGLYFQNNICVSNCSYNYFLVNSICTYCYQPCKICSGSTTVCSSCFINSTNPIFYNSYCITASQCPIGHYINSTNSSCEVCPVNCTSCTSPTVCSTCTLGYYLYGTLCLASCPNTTYSTSNSTTGVCQTCNSCQTCSSSTACTSCISSQYLYNDMCYSTCPNGSYPLGSICSVCSSSCPTCQNSTYCTSCVTSMNLYKGACYLTCPNSTYANTTLQLCQSCPASCATCTSTSSCQTCVTSYSLENSQCVLICSQGLSYNQVCYPCGLNCDICANATCTKCVNSYYLYNNTCLSQCPSNMFSLDTLTCTLCTYKFVNCSTCTTAQCLTCTYGQLLNGTCVPCSAGYYAESGACTACPSTCATCDSQLVCTTCIASHYLLNNQCSSSCPINMIPNGTTCSNCLAYCNVCNQVSSLCSVCAGGYYLYNNLCYSSCPSPLVVSYDFLTCVTEAVYYQQFSSAAKIVPFPFTIATCVIIIIGLILRCFYKQMHLQTVFCSLISIIQIATWIIFLAFEYMYFSNFHKLSFYNMICGAVGVALLVFINIVHLRFFYKYINKDPDFVKWVRKNGCSNGSILVFATLLNFKFYRFVHSRFLGREETSMVLTSPNRLVPFSMISIISIFLCSIPVFVGCALGLYNSISQDQQFFIALDTIVVTGIMILLILMDLRHADDYFSDEHQAKNLKKKAYQQQEIKFGQEFIHNNPLQDNISHEQLMQIQEDQGDMALPPSASKFQTTYDKTFKQRKLNAENSHHFNNVDMGSEENIALEQNSETMSVEEKKEKWKVKEYDRYGYLIKYDASNNPIKYDENGYRVEIDENGVHHRYNEQGHKMLEVNGVMIPHDKDGFQLINGKRYNSKGYQMREENGVLVPYDKNGFKVVGQGENEKHVDEKGYVVIADEKGNLRRYQEDGWEVVTENGQELLKNKEGQYVRKNKDGQWQIYDPKDGFIMRKNPKTGKWEKFNELGFRVVRDRYGNLHYYDQQGYKVTILPGNEIIRHDEQGYRIEKDENGEVHRFDDEGYEFIEDEEGNSMFIDKNGYRVQRDLYGRVTLYDKDNNQVRIDPETGAHRRFNEEGLEVVTDTLGNKQLIDKRGRIVKELPDSYEKYDSQGNKIWLDENGYEIQQDNEGNVNRYDKIGDRVETQYDIEQSEDGMTGNLMISTTKKPLKYHFKPSREVDQQEELNKLLSVNQPIQFQESEEEISQLHEFHDNYFPAGEKDVNHQFDKLVNKERSELLFKEEGDGALDDLKEFQHQQELYGHLVEPNIETLNGVLTGGQESLQRNGLANEQNQQKQFDKQLIMKNEMGQSPLGFNNDFQPGNHYLNDQNPNLQHDFDNEFALKPLDGKEPPLHNRPIAPHQRLIDNNLNRQVEFDQQFTVGNLDAKEPDLQNKALVGHKKLKDNEQGRQGEYDKQALVRQIDRKEPDVQQLKARDLERSQLARKRAADNNLKIYRDQDQIEIKSVADVSVDERSFQNQGVQPLQNRTDYDEINSLDEIQVPLGRKQRGNRSEVSLVNNKKDTQTVYNYNTVEVEIKNQNNLYDEDEEIESLHEEDWQEQMNPMMFARRAKEDSQGHNTNANTNILYVEDEEENNDALSDLVHQSQSKSKIRPQQNSRYRNDILSREGESIEQIEQKLFKEARHREMRERREFRLSGAPNPLVEFAKTIEANKKTLQEKMYLDQNYKRR